MDAEIATDSHPYVALMNGALETRGQILGTHPTPAIHERDALTPGLASQDNPWVMGMADHYQGHPIAGSAGIFCTQLAAVPQCRVPVILPLVSPIGVRFQGVCVGVPGQLDLLDVPKGWP